MIRDALVPQRLECLKRKKLSIKHPTLAECQETAAQAGPPKGSHTVTITHRLPHACIPVLKVQASQREEKSSTSPHCERFSTPLILFLFFPRSFYSPSNPLPVFSLLSVSSRPPRVTGRSHTDTRFPPPIDTRQVGHVVPRTVISLYTPLLASARSGSSLLAAAHPHYQSCGVGDVGPSPGFLLSYRPCLAFSLFLVLSPFFFLSRRPSDVRLPLNQFRDPALDRRA